MGVNAVMLSVPQFATDLRPTADAAASVREKRPPPAIALGPVQNTVPPVPTQAAAVSRVIIGASAIEGGPPPAAMRTGAEPTERRLVPFGVFMLPEPPEEMESRPIPQVAARDGRPAPDPSAPAMDRETALFRSQPADIPMSPAPLKSAPVPSASVAAATAPPAVARPAVAPGTTTEILPDRIFISTFDRSGAASATKAHADKAQD